MKTAGSLMLLLALATPASAQLINPVGPNGPCVEQPDGTCLPIQHPMPPRSPPPMLAQPMPQQYGTYMLCYSNDPVPGTKNMFISNVFQTNQTEADEQKNFNQFATQQRYNVTFTCQSGDSRQRQQQLGQITVNFANRGYNVNQIRHR